MKHEFLDIIAEYHEDWLRIVNSFGQVNCAEDLVQEAYLKMDKYCTKDKVIKNDKPNKTYIWYVLKSVFLDYENAKNKVIKTELKNNLSYDCQDENFESAFDEILYKINKEKSTWTWYDVQLFDLYTKSDMSMRDIEKATTISLRSIYTTIKNCKERLRAAIGEDYQDFLNGDYDKI